jgi:hypothetical protein
METFVKKELDCQTFNSNSITEPTLFRGFGIGDWDVLVIPVSTENMEIRYVRTRVSGSLNNELTYRVTQTLDTRRVHVTTSSVIKLGNANQGWWVQVIPKPIWQLAQEKGVRVRLVRTLKDLPDRESADRDATEYLEEPWYRTRSYQWAEPLSGFKPTEAHYRGHYRGWECRIGSNIDWGEYVFSRNVGTDRIVEFLQGLN